MPEPDTPQILLLLKKSDLLNPAELETAKLLAAKRGTAGSGDWLLQELVTRDILTAWQRDQLLRGETGFVLRQYRILESVGKGGMGHVFKAHDRETGATVAIKVMARKLTSNQSLVNRFRREIEASSRLRSPHVVRTLDAGRVGKVDFMVMEFVNGFQLDQLIGRDRILPAGLACEIVRQAAIGLQHAHDEQMVHRDIKPANLMIDWLKHGRGTVKVMDMGLVRLNTESEEHQTVTHAGQVMGTPEYMSPEQGWDTGQVDIRSDIYSLGCTLFRLLTGRVPFHGGNPLQVLMARCSRDAPSVRSLCPGIPEMLDAVVCRMTMRDPAHRYQVPHDVALALTPFCQPLTRSSFEACSASPLVSAGTPEKSETSYDPGRESGYQAFLKEMATGEVTDRFLVPDSPSHRPELPMPTMSDDPLACEFSLTASERPQLVLALPIIDAGLTPASPAAPRSRLRRTKPQQTSRMQRVSRSLPGPGVRIAAAALIPGVGFLLFLLSGDLGRIRNWLSGQEQPAAEAASADLPAASIVIPPPQQVAPGETFRLTPQVQIADQAVSGHLVFELDQPAPAAATINPDTGEVVWEVPVLQSPAEYWLPVKLILRENGRDTTVCTSRITVTVSPTATPKPR